MINIKSINWVDIVSIFMLITGMILTFLSPSMIIFYIICLLSGTLFGRLLYKTKNTLQFKYYLIASAYLLGLLVGNFIKSYGLYIWPIIIFIFGIIISYKMTLKQ